MAEYLETLRPAGAALTVSAPVAQIINVVVSGLVPNTTAVQEAARPATDIAIPVGSIPVLGTVTFS